MVYLFISLCNIIFNFTVTKLLNKTHAYSRFALMPYLQQLHMTDSQICLRVKRHRRSASHCTLNGIYAWSPIHDWEHHDERNRIRRDRGWRVRMLLLQKLRDYFGIPRDPPTPRRVPQQLPHLELPIIISSDDSHDDIPDPEPYWPPPVIDIFDSSDSDAELPDIAQAQ